MARLLQLKTHRDPRGALTVLQDEVPFTIRRVYYIYRADHHTRGGHRHHKAVQMLACLNGSCEIYVHDGKTERTYELTDPGQALLVEPADWHHMKFGDNAVLLVLASEPYDPADYIDQPYPPA